MRDDIREKQLRYLSQSIRLREAPCPPLIRRTIEVIIVGFIVTVTWAAMAHVHEIAHAPGEIIPLGKAQVVQHLEGGIVKDIPVNDGDYVRKGDTVLSLDGAGVGEDMARAKERLLTLSMQEERLRAFAEKREPAFSPEIMARPYLLRDQETFFDDFESARNAESSVIRNQIEQKRQARRAITSEYDAAKADYALSKSLYDRRVDLNRQGYLPDVKLLQTRQDMQRAQGRMNTASARISEADSAITEMQSRLSSLESGNKNTVSERLDAILSEKRDVGETLQKLENRVARLDVKAPVDGRINGLATTTIGAVVGPGQVLMEIVPDDRPLVVDLKVPPRHIGHISIGQEVRVKVSSYDFVRYGAVPARLSFISPTTFASENGERYYQARAELLQKHIGNNPKDTFVPGMTVMADIITGDKSVLAYLLKPVRTAFASSFTER